MNVSVLSNEVMLEDERVMKLEYFLTERNSDEVAPYYGVRIVKKLEDLIEADEITGVSESKDKVISIIRKLHQFQVTPISMVEIMDELVTAGM